MVNYRFDSSRRDITRTLSKSVESISGTIFSIDSRFKSFVVRKRSHQTRIISVASGLEQDKLFYKFRRRNFFFFQSKPENNNGTQQK